jgi:hypothetical protein
MARANIDSAGWTWSAVASGVIASLVVQIILTMLGFAAGLVGADSASSAKTAVWLGFAWWSFSGIFAAAAGGWVAGILSPTRDERLKGIGGLTAWAVATIIVVAVSGLAAGAGTTTAGALAGPVIAAGTNYQNARESSANIRRETVGQTMRSGPTADQARKQLSIAMLVSAVALVFGAVAAYFAACFAPSRRALEAD